MNDRTKNGRKDENMLVVIKDKIKKKIKLTVDEAVYLMKHAGDYLSEEEIRKVQRESEMFCREFMRKCTRLKDPKNWKKTK
ncbi:MAG: hypothetical protein WC788_05805 [Candidatus Paceibacterota bacterium]|jgi:hypothetical protein